MKISVIGAGIMGVMSAYTLRQHMPDAHITIIDRDGFPAHNASFMAGGMLAPLSELDHMPVDYLPAGFNAIAMWKEISDSFGQSFEFAQNGSLFLSHDEDRHMLRRFQSILPPHEDWKTLNQHDITALESHIPLSKFQQGLFMAGEAHLHPQKAMQALLRQIEHQDMRDVSIADESVNADWVIDCRGMGAQASQQNLRGVKGETIIVHNPDFNLSRPIRLMHPRYPLYIVPRDDGIFMIGATIIESEEGAHMTLRSGMELMSALYSLHPSFGDSHIIEINAGIRPSYMDNLPQIRVQDRVISCNGLYRHGYLFSPVMADIISDIIAGKEHEFSSLFIREETHENYA